MGGILVASALVGGLALVALEQAALAQSGGAGGQELGSSAGRWTAGRLRDATPRPRPKAVRPDGTADLPADGQSRIWRSPETPRLKPASPPEAPAAPAPEELYQPAPPDGPSAGPGRAPRAATPSGALHTTSRVFPPAATTAFPYRAVGKLFFFDPVARADFECSGAVIEARLVLTAGHCVYDPVAGEFFREFLFVPAHDRGRAPFGSWRARRVWTTDAWIEGRNQGLDGFPSEGDFAILEIRDRRVGGRRQRIGEVTGTLGFASDVLFTHATLLGYPGNLDRGERMQQSSAETFDLDGRDGILFGSSMLEGSSGGPIIENFGPRAIGSQDFGRNVIVGVISYGLADDPEIAGTSRLRGAFVELFDRACARQRLNCEVARAPAVASRTP